MKSAPAKATYDGLAAPDLARLAHCPLVHLHDSVGSTLDLAHELGSTGAPHGAIVLAEAQTAGRGRQGRPWASPAGGLWLAFLARPDRPPAGGVMGIRAGLAARAAIAEVAPECVPRIKWPNDLIVANRKAGGVLCEASWTGATLGWIAVGIGINVAGPVPRDVAATAVALADVAPHVTRSALLATLAPRLLAMRSLPPELDDGERSAFLDHLWAAPGEAPGHALAPDGALLVRGKQGAVERRTAPA